MTYKEAEAYINETPRFTTKNKPEHTREFLRRLGNPQEKFETIHVAGSNGKGSVCAMIHSALMEGKKKTGLFVSPHLVKITERFMIQGEPCSDEAFVSAFREVCKVIDEMGKDGLPHPTYFEMIFAIGMMIFEREEVEIAVIETGLGGRLDATNVLTKPLVTVITSISLEHTEYLGDTLEAIAGEKAGIMKEMVPVVFDAKHGEVSKVIFDRAKQLKAPSYPVYPGDIQIVGHDLESLTFCFDLNGHKNPVTVPFPAQYQAENGALAMQTCELLIQKGYLTYGEFEAGMKKTRWPGRMQQIEPKIYLDGAHNVDGISRLIQSVKSMGLGKVRLLFAMVKEKNYELAISRLSKELEYSKIVVTQIEGDRLLKTEVVADLFKENCNAEIIEEKDIRKAYEFIKEEQAEETIICTGSLYLVGEILRIKEEKDD